MRAASGRLSGDELHWVGTIGLSTPVEKSMAATIKDVANEAGVSTATVSRVLNQPHTVAPERVKKVKAAISKLQYSPNLMAANLSRSRGLMKQQSKASSSKPADSKLSHERPKKQKTSSLEQVRILKTENKELKRIIRQFSRHLSKLTKLTA